MTVAAKVIQYRKEFVQTFEQTVSILRATCTKEAVIKGQQATFLVAGSGGATAVTRGVNGEIPYSAVSNTQATATLTENHAPFEITGFNIFASQGDQNAIMRKSSMAVINRHIDDTIITIMDTSTQDVSNTSATASLDLVTKAIGILGGQNVDVEDEANMFAAITPGFRSYLLQTTEFASGDYVDVKPFAGVLRKMWRWAGINWHVSTRLTGIGTATEKCYLWHRDALGYAVNVGEDNIMVGYDEKQDTSWSRATIFDGAVLLQNSGIVRMNHDGSAFVAV